MSGPSDLISLENRLTNVLQAFLWFSASTLMMFEPLRTQIHRNVSINMVLINLIGSTFWMVWAFYGYFGNPDFSDNVDWSQVFSSSYFMLANLFGFFLLRSKKNLENDFDFYGISVSLAGIFAVVGSFLLNGESDQVFEDCYAIFNVMFLMGYPSQIELLARNRYTRGWSIHSSVFQILWALFSMVDVIFDFGAAGLKRTMPDDLDMRTLIWSLFVVLFNAIIIRQFWVYRNHKFGKNHYMMDLQELKVSLLSKSMSSVSRSFA